MTTKQEKKGDDPELIESILGRVTQNLTMLLDREFVISDVEVERAFERPAGADVVHISSRLLFRRNGEELGQGCLLLPLPEAIAMSCYLMMLPDPVAQQHRKDESPDESMKEAIMELGAIISTAVEEGVRGFEPQMQAKYKGCQGVLANVRPAMAYEDGSELMVARATAQLHDAPPFELILMMPPVLDLCSEALTSAVSPG